MIPLIAHAIRAGVVVLAEIVGEVIARRRERRAELSPTCPACDDDPAERCPVCRRRASRVEA